MKKCIDSTCASKLILPICRSRREGREEPAVGENAADCVKWRLLDEEGAECTLKPKPVKGG